jgi:hypothetical protein
MKGQVKTTMYILPEFQKEYEEKIDLGKQYINNKKIVIVGLARNQSDTLISCLNQLGELHQLCKTLSCFIYENNSTDSTYSLLTDYRDSKNDYTNFHFYSETLETNEHCLPRSVDKCRIMSYARNLSKNFVQTYYSYYDYVIVVDTNFRQININGILNSFGWFFKHYDNIDAIGGFKFAKNSENNKELINLDDWCYRFGHWEDTTKRFIMSSNNFDYNPMLWFSKWIPLVGAAPIKVNSVFGGICIYKTDKYLSGQYEDYDADHVTFHKSIDFKNPPFNIYANPSQYMFME